ncbi:MAG: MoaD/ThiS family protein [Nitrospinaceae bacterium]
MAAAIGISVHVPALLAHCTGDRRELRLQAATLGDALGKLWASHPLLHYHFHDKAGGLRPHVLIFYNQEDIRHLKSLDLNLREGDSLTLMQAVSGGAPVHPVAAAAPSPPIDSPADPAKPGSGKWSPPP